MSRPETLQECVQELLWKMGSWHREQMEKKRPSELWKAFRSMGNYVEKEWLQDGSPLRAYLQNIGLENTDDMKGLIMAALYREVKKQPVKEEILVRELQDFWKAKHALTTNDWNPEDKFDPPFLSRLFSSQSKK